MSKGLIKALFVGGVLYALSCLVHDDPKPAALHNLHEVVSAADPSSSPPSPLIAAQIARGPRALRYEVSQAKTELASVGLAPSSLGRVTADADVLEAPLNNSDAAAAETDALERADLDNAQYASGLQIFVDGHSRTVALLRRAYGPGGPTKAPGMTPATTRGMDSDAYLMIVAARLREHDGDHTGAIENYTVALRIADACSRLGTPYAYWTAQTVRLITLGDLRDLVKSDEGDPRVVEAAREMLIGNPIPTPVDLPIATDLERKIALSSPGKQETGPDGPYPGPPSARALFSSIHQNTYSANLSAATTAYTVKTLTKLLDLQQLSPEERCVETDRLTQTEDNDPTQIEVALVGPFYRDLVRRDALTQARQAVLIEATGIILARDIGNKLPAAAPDRIIDPFSGQPLTYVSYRNGGFLVYSTGDTTESSFGDNPLDRFYNAYFKDGPA